MILQTMPPIALILGGGVMTTVGVGVVGFVCAVRSDLSVGALTIAIGTTATVLLTGLVWSPEFRVAVTAVAYLTLVGFPLSALFWLLTAFTNRVVSGSGSHSDSTPEAGSRS